MPLVQGVHANLIGDFSSVQGIRQILFVCKHQKNSITKLVLAPYDNNGDTCKEGADLGLALPCL